MSNDTEIQRIIGQLVEGQTTLKAEVHALREQVQQLITLAATARGGWRVLFSVAGVSTTVGAAVAGAFHRLWP